LQHIFRSGCTSFYGSWAKELAIAKWPDRLIAWLIDFIVVGAVAEALFTAFALPFAFRFSRPELNGVMNVTFGFLQVRSVIHLAYWTYFESTSGQSLGKK